MGDMNEEELDLVRSWIKQVITAQKIAPESPVLHVFDCACSGPVPGCHCEKRSEAVEKFLNKE